jgi:hypothetical protein
MSFREENHSEMMILTYVLAGLSLLGSVFVIGMYLIFPDLKTFAYRLVIYISMMDIMVSFCYISPDTPEVWCIIKACILSCGCLGRVIFIFLISKSIYTSYFSYNYKVEKYEKRYVLAGVGIMLMLIAMPLTTGSYGDANTSCWINATGDNYIAGSVWRVVVYYGPCITISVLVARMYAKIVQSLRERIHTNDNTRSLAEYTLELLKKFKLYPLFNLGVVLPAIVNRIYDAIYPDDPHYALMLIATIPWCVIGFVNAILFMRTPTVKMIILRILSPRKFRDSVIIQSTASYDQITG